MTFGRSVAPAYEGRPVLDPQAGQSVLYRRKPCWVLRVWDEPVPSGGAIKLARIQFGNHQERTVFAAQLEEPA